MIDHPFEEEDHPFEVPPQVTWVLGLDDAELLHDYLHHNRPGGYQHVHDGLREAIGEARTTLFGRFLAGTSGEELPDIDRNFVGERRDGTPS